MTCPRCSAEAAEGALDCPSCGVVFAKWRADGPPRSSAVARTAYAAVSPWSLRDPQTPPEAEYLGIPHSGWKAAAIGLVLAFVLTFFPFLSFLLSPLGTLVHEIGHTVMFWLFGYAAIPAFDFGEGGGMTMADPKTPMIVWAWGFGLLALAWFQRDKPLRLAGFGVVAVVYFLMYGGRGEQTAIALGGHGGEVVFGGLFLYRALTGWGCKVAAERPLYAFLAFKILFASVQLGFMLLGNDSDKLLYLMGKRGIDNDLVTGAELLRTSMDGIARMLIAASMAAIPLAFWAAAIRKTIGAVSEAEEEI